MKRILLVLLLTLPDVILGEEPGMGYEEVPASVLDSIKKYSVRTVAMMKEGGPTISTMAEFCQVSE